MTTSTASAPLTSSTTQVVLFDLRSPRKRERLVGTFGAQVADGSWRFEADHGGTVANRYGYRTETQVRAMIVSPDGRSICAYSQIEANKATERGAALATIPEIADLFDGRCGEARREKAREAAKALFARSVG